MYITVWIYMGTEHVISIRFLYASFVIKFTSQAAKYLDILNVDKPHDPYFVQDLCA